MDLGGRQALSSRGVVIETLPTAAPKVTILKYRMIIYTTILRYRMVIDTTRLSYRIVIDTGPIPLRK